MLDKIAYPDLVRPFHRNGSGLGDRYDLVVVGAGSAGLVAAMGGARMGARVALVERNLIGGDCLNVGCVPSKALVAAARKVHEIGAARAFGIGSAGVEVDFPSVMARMRDLRARFGGNDSTLRLISEGIDVVPGEAVFDSPRSMIVGTRRIEFTRAIIATGSAPYIPPIEGLDGVGYLTNETLFDLEEMPRSMAIIGGGPQGCELGQALARLGCEVTILQRSRRLLPREDAQASGLVRESLEADGVSVCLGVEISSVFCDGGNTVVRYSSEQGSRDLSVERVLVAAGRSPRIEGLGLDAAEVAFDDKGILVDRGLRSTSNARIFGAGDVCLSHKSAHSADMSARICLRNAFFPGTKTFDSVPVARCTYTDPEVARVGLTLDQALEQGMKVKEIKVPMDDMDRAVMTGNDRGFLKVVTTGSGRIVGATLVASRAGDIISELTLAMSGGIKLGELSWVMHPYPTEGAVFRRSADIFNGRRMTPLLRAFFQLWMVILSKFKDRAQREAERAAKAAAKATKAAKSNTAEDETGGQAEK